MEHSCSFGEESDISQMTQYALLLLKVGCTKVMFDVVVYNQIYGEFLCIIR